MERLESKKQNVEDLEMKAIATFIEHMDTIYKIVGSDNMNFVR